MLFGAHLPLIDFGQGTPALTHLQAYTARAAELGFRYLCANDHMLFARPWLDGPTALAATLPQAQDMTLATTVALPTIRGPLPLAKTLAALDILSAGRLVAGVGPGSSPADYAAAGVPFDERWPRFEESIGALRALLRGEPADGRFYGTDAVLEPRPVSTGGPPIWVASWGSPAGLRRVARLGDGWLASAYNTTPERFHENVLQLPGHIPNGLSTAWLYVTERKRDVNRVLTYVLAPMLKRPVDALRELALPIGSAEDCAERVHEWAAAGVQRLFVWPLGDDLRQLELFADALSATPPSAAEAAAGPGRAAAGASAG